VPLYEFYCSDCREVFEKLVRGADGDKVTCVTCGGARVSKILSTFSALGTSDAGATGLGTGCGCGAGGCGCHR
jgi:putative FmdB family regulatory protein